MCLDAGTPSMEKAIKETQRRREIQMQYNEENNIIPKTIIKDVSDIIEISTHKDDKKKKNKPMTKAEIKSEIDQLTREMKNAAKMLEFEHAAFLRDKINKLKS